MHILHSFNDLGDDPTLQAYTQSDVLNKIKEFKQGEEFTTEKEEQINKLALDSQVNLGLYASFVFCCEFHVVHP